MEDPAKGIKDDIKAYRELQSVANAEEFDVFFDLLMKTVSSKMVWAFTTDKDGKDNIQNWEDFCRVKGEIAARLQPIQEIRGAGAMAEYLTKQLEEYYSKS